MVMVTMDGDDASNIDERVFVVYRSTEGREAEVEGERAEGRRDQ